MTHDEIQDRLEEYVDDRLDREERRTVDRHLAACAECRTILDEVAPVDLSGLGPSETYDESAMRRTVRRSIFRTAINAALLLLAAWIAIWFFSALVVQPLLVNRGDRAAETAQASIDIGTMTNPGAVLTEGRIDSGWLDREVEVRFSLPVGAALEPMLETTTTIGLLGLMDEVTDSALDDRGFQGDALGQLRNLGDGTVSTVAIRFETPVTIETTQDLTDDPGADVRVVWAGFDASLGRDVPPAWTGAGALGYGTCQEDRPFDGELLGATSAGFSQGSLFRDASVERAHQLVVSALENITGSAEIENLVAVSYGEDPDEIEEVLEAIRTSPQVSTIVVTGPSPEVASFVASLDDEAFASLLAVDFYNWTQGICGR